MKVHGLNGIIYPLLQGDFSGDYYKAVPLVAILMNPDSYSTWNKVGSADFAWQIVL